MSLYILDYGAGNVRSLANSVQRLGFSFQWIVSPDDFHKAQKLIFPGVGAFGAAVAHLESRGLLQPLKDYILSGKPYFGICIGLQILFHSSAESPSTRGLGIIDDQISRFDSSQKSVPHIGWNTVQACCSDDSQLTTHAAYYFVHSYRATSDPRSVNTKDWAFATTQYGSEIFLSAVKKNNVFATQFHPEKSGAAGLALLGAWLSDSPLPLFDSVHATSSSKASGLTKRIIACLDVRSNDDGDLVVTKGDQYDVRERSNLQSSVGGAVRNLGKPVTLAARYYEEGADELCFLNITSFRQCPLLDQPMLAVVRSTAERVFVPLTIGGGIKDTVDPDGTVHSALEVASEYFRAGADKVSIGSEAVFIAERSLKGEDVTGNAISSIADTYGNQAVVISIDPRRVYVDVDYDGERRQEVIVGEGADTGKAWWYQCTVFGGREARPLSVCQLALETERLGAGELLVNSIDRDGTGLGFDLDLLKLLRKTVTIPIIASSGAGSATHFAELLSTVDVEAALAAGIFHRNEVTIPEVKSLLHNSGIRIRAT